MLLWWFLFVMWWLLWRPGMVQWYHERKTRKQDLSDLRAVTCVEDMFKENR